MAKTDDKNSTGWNGIPVVIVKQIRTYIANAQANPPGWAPFFEELQAIVSQLAGPDAQDVKISYMAVALDAFRERIATSLSKTETIELLLKAGETFETLGAWDKAIAVYRDIIQMCNEGAFDSYKAQAMRWIGYIYSMKSQWKAAQQHFEDSLYISLSSGDKESEIASDIALGHLYFEQGAYEQVSLHWKKALSMADRYNEVLLTAKVENNLGTLANVQGQWENALAFYSNSIPRFEKIGQKRGLAETYHNMAMTYADAECWADASNCYEKSYDLAKEIGEIRLQAMIYLNRVELYLNVKDLRFAEALCKRALKIFQQLEDRLGEAEVYKFLGIITREKRQSSAAQNYLEKSIHLARTFENPLLEAETLLEYGRLYKLDGEKPLAKATFENALAIFIRLNAAKKINTTRRELQDLS